MTRDIFEKFEDDFLQFDQVQNPLNRRPDLCAFLMLDQIVPVEQNRLGGCSDMVCSAEHDEIWLSVDVEALLAAATEDQLRDLHRCGVRYDKSVDSLSMFV